MFAKYPLLMRFLCWILLPLVALLLWLALYLKSTLPVTHGSRLVSGINADVLIQRDKQGVVYIESESERDAHFAVGYAHAQDRLWQLELNKRMAQGRLSEIFGKSSLSGDTWFRTLNINLASQQAWQSLSPEAKASLTAYRDGINAWLREQHTLPVEFAFFDIKPEPWTVYDSLATIKLFSLNLSGNFRKEVEYLVASERLLPQQLATFFPEYPKDGPLTVKTQNSSMLKLAELLAHLESDMKIGGQFVGSNAWAVAPQHTQSGSAILASDPHLGLSLPSHWYAVDMQFAQRHVIGMTLVGTPAVIFGKNSQITWAGTNLTADTQDLYFVETVPDKPNYYLVNNEQLPFTTRREVIQVAQDFPAFLRQDFKPVEILVRETVAGPVVNDFLKLSERPIALKWAALQYPDSSYEAFYRINKARNWRQFKQALNYHVSPVLNFLYADANGNIGYTAGGKIPVRGEGQGRLPVVGLNLNSGWQGYIPDEELPAVYNPESGVLVSANNKVIDDHYPYFISNEWAPPARAARIQSLLDNVIASGEKLSVQEMQRLQSDTHDLAIQKLMPLFLAYQPRDEHQEVAFSYLRQWDGHMRQDSVAATIVMAWISELKKRLFQDDIEQFWNQKEQEFVLVSLAKNVSTETLFAILSHDEQGWCDNQNTPEIESCQDTLDEALYIALKDLYLLKGDESMASWAWGEVHHTLYPHQPFSHIKVLDNIFERRISNGGSANSINVAGSQFKKSEGYEQTFGAGFRQIVSPGLNPAQYVFMNSTGQSSNVVSQHYDDMIEPFRDVKYVEFSRANDELMTLTLTPADAVEVVQ